MSGNNLLTEMYVRPSRALVDEKFRVVLRNLFPGQKVTLHAQMRSDDDDVWHAYGHYVSDEEGTIKVAEHVCVGGSYIGIEPMGLLWSMKPVPGSRTELRLRKKDVSTPMVVHISAYGGHIGQGFREAPALACVVAERWYMSPGVRRVDVTEGGRSSCRLPRCLVAVSRSHVQPEWGCLSDIFKEINKNSHKTRFDEEGRLIWRDLLLPIPSNRRQKVAMGRLPCPLLLIVGEDDQNWPSSESAKDMEKMMAEAGNAHLLTVLSYPAAGHLIEPPYTPHIRSSNFIVGQTGKKVVVLWGGEVVAHSNAQEDSWCKALAFLRHHLYCPDPKDPGDQ